MRNAGVTGAWERLWDVISVGGQEGNKGPILHWHIKDILQILKGRFRNLVFSQRARDLQQQCSDTDHICSLEAE